MVEISRTSYYSYIPLADELERQRIEITERIAVPLGLDRNKFQANLPTRFPDRPQGYDSLHLNVPLIAPDFTSLGFTWLQVTEAANFYNPNYPETIWKAYIWTELRNSITNDKLKVWRDPRRGVEPFPQTFHAVWIQDGSRYVGKKPIKVRQELQEAERAGDHFKGTGLSLLRPDMTEKPWDLIGGQVGAGRVPDVLWDGGPGFSYGWDGTARPRFRALVCGSEFTVA